jgi:hypothetical protein
MLHALLFTVRLQLHLLLPLIYHYVLFVLLTFLYGAYMVHCRYISNNEFAVQVQAALWLLLFVRGIDKNTTASMPGTQLLSLDSCIFLLLLFTRTRQSRTEGK